MLTLDAGPGDEALATESIEASVDGDDITTGFNPQFLLDGLSAIEAAGRRAGLHPGLQAGGDAAAPPATASPVRRGDFHYLLMPRRLLS